MVAIFFLYGLAFFSLGLIALLVSRRDSELPLKRQLPWLAGFGITHACVEWLDMFLFITTDKKWLYGLETTRIVLLPLSALLLVRFGIGLISEAGPLPDWLNILPMVLVVPAALLVAYALILSATVPDRYVAADIWSRYLLYMPGCLLSAFGFYRQWREIKGTKLSVARNLFRGAGAAFLVNAIVAGMIVPAGQGGLSAVLNYDTVMAYTGVPVQVWRALSAVAVMILVTRAFDVFDAEQGQQIQKLQEERARAQEKALTVQSEARQTAENWTEALVDIGRGIANMESVDQVLVGLVQKTRTLMDVDVVSLGLFDESGQALDVKYHANAKRAFAASAPIRMENNTILSLILSCRPYRYPEDVDTLEANWYCPTVAREVKAAAIVPLRFDEQPVGALWIGRFGEISFTPYDLVRLERLADQAVIALEHASMAARLQSLAMVKERSRIAREMHDGLLQVLGYLNVELQTLEALVSQGKPQATLAELQQARERINAAQADVRENILSLRTTLAGETDLVPSLKAYLEEFSVQTGIQAKLENQLDGHSPSSPLVEAQLVRIVQEALTNVRKHAMAKKVVVRLACIDHMLNVTIEDDGVGFDHEQKRRHFGLQTMRERAESVGGSLAVQSSPGEGTQVELWLPLVQD